MRLTTSMTLVLTLITVTLPAFAGPAVAHGDECADRGIPLSLHQFSTAATTKDHPVYFEHEAAAARTYILQTNVAGARVDTDGWTARLRVWNADCTTILCRATWAAYATQACPIDTLGVHKLEVVAITGPGEEAPVHFTIGVLNGA